MRAQFERSFRASLTPNKAAVVASNSKLANALGKALGDAAGKTVESAEFLGCDFAPGRCRHLQGRSGRRRKRIAIAVQRKRRIMRLRKAAGSVASNVFLLWPIFIIVSPLPWIEVGLAFFRKLAGGGGLAKIFVLGGAWP